MEVFTNTIDKRGNESAKIAMSGVHEAEIGAPECYGGNPDALNPEEMFVASINSCIMLVFYHFADKYKVELRSYSTEAAGTVEKTKNGLRFTSVDVRAKVSLDDESQAEKIEKIAELAEKYCLVSGSVSCPVSYEVELLDETNE